MKLAGLCVFLLLFCSLKGSAQEIQVGLNGPRESFLETTEMKKVLVCADDHSVWALSLAGEAYYKSAGATSFVKLSLLSGIRDLAGYSLNEMYFVTEDGARLDYVANLSQVTRIAYPAELTSVNDIAVVNAGTNEFLNGYLPGSQDWLAIASTSSLYRILRNSPLQSPIVNGEMTTTISSSGWRITNSGYKTIDFQYKYPHTNCFGEADFRYYNRVGTEQVQTELPENAPVYSDPVNCTYFEPSYNHTVDGPSDMLRYWGTDKGLFTSRALDCDASPAGKLLDLKVNDIKQMNVFRDFFNQKVLLAGTAKGLFVGSNSTVPLGNNPPDPNNSNLFRLGNYERSVNSIALEVSGYTAGGRDALCEKAVWLATADGIQKITLLPAKIALVNYSLLKKAPDILYVENQPRKNIFPMCNGEAYTLKTELPASFVHTYSIEWLRADQNWGDEVERLELVNLRDQKTVLIDNRGFYGLRLTTACGESMVVGNMWLREPEKIVTDFNYPPVLKMFDGCTFTFTAKAGNPYRWTLDGNVIPGETSNTLKATKAGKYQLQYPDCSGAFISSDPIDLQLAPAAAPIIERSSTRSLCFGEKITLTTPEVEGATYKWSNGSTSRSIEVSTSGNYHVDVVLGCSKRSPSINVTVNPELKLTAPSEVQVCTLREQKLKLQAPAGFTAYNWDGVAGTEPSLEVMAPGVHTLEVVDANGCKATGSYVVVAYCPPLLPPNAFSPNGDGLNDVWKVEGLEEHPETVVKIYNRFGGLVYEQRGSKQVWDGRLDGTDVPVGIYYFVVSNTQNKAMTGSLALIR